MADFSTLLCHLEHVAILSPQAAHTSGLGPSPTDTHLWALKAAANCLDIWSRWQILDPCQGLRDSVMKVFQTSPAFIDTEMVIRLAGYNQTSCAKSRNAECIWNHGRDLNRVNRIGKCESVCMMEDESGCRELPIT